MNELKSLARELAEKLVDNIECNIDLVNGTGDTSIKDGESLIRTALETVQTETVRRTLERAIEATRQAFGHEYATFGEIAIRALIDKPAPDPTPITAIFGDGETKIVRTGPNADPLSIETAGRIILELQDRVSELEAPDPLLGALAGFFAAWWTQIASAEAAAVQRGLAVRGSVLTLELTELGKAAIALAEAGR